MFDHVIRRLPRLVATLLVVSVCTFLLTDLLPGDPALAILGENATDEAVAGLRDEMRLDDPLPQRYLGWLGDVVTGDLGESYRTGQPVTEAIGERLPVTIEIGLLSIVMALAVAVPTGIWSAYRAGGALDRATTTASFGLMAVPSFMLGMFLILVFAVRLSWLPSTGWVRLSEDPWGNLQRAVLPATALAAGELALFVRVLRSDMMTILQQDSIAMARAKGLSTARILFLHALRPGSLSLMTVVGVQLGGIVGGSVIVETMFALPGLGRLLADSIAQRDLLTVQGIALVVAAACVVVNFATDTLYTLLDPRIRHDVAGG